MDSGATADVHKGVFAKPLCMMAFLGKLVPSLNGLAFAPQSYPALRCWAIYVPPSRAGSDNGINVIVNGPDVTFTKRALPGVMRAHSHEQ